ncbi:hypothetical protein I6A84_10440 [Frankia sp. CNm7]|uniref:Uncharacterized protein n=2 Tax=Frankia TaxID=1854 RepID=A0A937RC13_9ACTN|nr:MULTISPECIES: hypothetical protein [Frankia]KJE25289.1 hypothetical protein FF36_00422 [Frankia torreyi]MBL7496948.1 hypothetical protein [Frankia nepalensis]MBL7513438.1 hypothetical protein [Frankia nepalensis]MBL7518518.1 hypothetical protein [Frankia nepalensis]MBL7626119.1 hypothetical protein [Frankia nepalensis]
MPFDLLNARLLAGAGLLPLLYLLLVATVALTAVYTRDGTRRRTALQVLQILLFRRQKPPGRRASRRQDTTQGS